MRGGGKHTHRIRAISSTFECLGLGVVKPMESRRQRSRGPGQKAFFEDFPELAIAPRRISRFALWSPSWLAQKLDAGSSR